MSSSVENDSPEVKAMLQRIEEFMQDPPRPDRSESRTMKLNDVAWTDWIDLDERYSEQLDCKLEYHGSENTVVVTLGRSNVQQSLHVLLKPFSAIVHAADGFHLQYNVGLFTGSRPSRGVFIPDLTVTKDGVYNVAEPRFLQLPQYPIVFECGDPLSSFEDLRGKIPQYLDGTRGLLAVVCLFLHGEPYRNPPASYPVGLPKEPSDIKWEPREPLGDVTFEGHTWAPGIREITMEIYRNTDPVTVKKIDGLKPAVITIPATEDSSVEDQRAEVEHILGVLLQRTMTVETYVSHSGDGLELDWDGWLVYLDREVQLDAYDRYLRWMPPQVPSCPVKDEDEIPEREYLEGPRLKQLRLMKESRAGQV
ncbi:hypothetical protein FB45DRAFT_941739 [Roridomyces roridus]|uniref:Uncharacterized protein n=1 Tax=Roridomyces roridus TaxID=1738132 RepID=A0AAD7F9L6_9AGAR|nr:hypothetical protein FB45DRAFT_941739 [Roridomyces roridus]